MSNDQIEKIAVNAYDAGMSRSDILISARARVISGDYTEDEADQIIRYHDHCLHNDH